MNAASIYYLGVTIVLFVIFAMIVVRTCSRNNRQKGEAPKYRMLDDD